MRKGKAVIHKKHPFTIRLKEHKEVNKKNKDEYRLKIDYGSRYTGLAILKKNKGVVWLAQIEHRTDIKKKLDNRRAYRRRRRSKNLRYRQPRFDNRKRKKGWIPPSLQSRVDNIESWVNKLIKLCPLTHISYENVKFDTQLMNDSTIKGIEYQQGTLMGYEIREYLLEKFKRKCVYCGKTDIPLEIEHIIPKSRGGSNKIDNLAIACRSCNQAKDRRKYFFGFMSGDMVKAIVPKGKNKGIWHGSVACRSTGSFDINLKKGRIQGINHKYCQIVQKSDGYKYTLERREMELPHSSHS